MKVKITAIVTILVCISLSITYFFAEYKIYHAISEGVYVIAPHAWFNNFKSNTIQVVESSIEKQAISNDPIRIELIDLLSKIKSYKQKLVDLSDSGKAIEWEVTIQSIEMELEKPDSDLGIYRLTSSREYLKELQIQFK